MEFRKQFDAAKREHPKMLLLFRMGDFYELFDDDARVAAKTLNLTLTTRGEGDSQLAMVGFPHHSLEQHLKTLLKAGHRVTVLAELNESRR